MNRILKQRFNQISRQNNFLYVSRTAAHQKIEPASAKIMPARPVQRPETDSSTVRRG